LFNTLPPHPADPASTVRAPSLEESGGDPLGIRMPPQGASPLITTSPPPGKTTAPPGAERDRELSLARLRQRRERMTDAQVAALFKILE